MLEHWDWSWAGHGVSFATLAGVLLGVFTPLASVLTCIWLGVQLYECRPMQRLLARRRIRKLVLMRLKVTALEGVLRADSALADKLNER